MTVHAPLHINSVNHFDRPLLDTRATVARRAINAPLDMDPVREDDKFRELVHPLPWNLLPRFHISDHFQCLGSFTDGIARMAGLTEFDVGNPGNTISIHVAVAERTVQFCHLFVVDMIEQDGLIHWNPGQNRKDRIE